MISKAEFEFLLELQENNNREWFALEKKRFEKHQEMMKTFFQDINEALGKQDSIDKMQVHRIYRDTRFSKDKNTL